MDKITRRLISSGILGFLLLLQTLYINFSIFAFDSSIDIALQSGHSAEVVTIAYSNNGKYILSAGMDEKIILWDAYSGGQIRTFHSQDGPAVTLAFSPKDNRFLSASINGTLFLWDLLEKKPVKTFKGSGMPLLAAMFSPDGRFIAACDKGGVQRTFNIASGNQESILFYEFSGGILDISPNGKQMLLGSEDGVGVFEFPSGKHIKYIPTNEEIRILPIHSAVFSPENEEVIIQSLDGEVSFWDIESGKKINVISGIEFDVADFSPDNRYLLQVGGLYPGGMPHLRRINLLEKTSTVIYIEELNEVVKNMYSYKNSVAISPDGESAVFLLASSMGMMYKYYFSDRFKYEKFQGHEESINKIAFAPGGKAFVTASDDFTLKMWESGNNKYIRSLIGHNDAVRDFALSSDGRFIVSVSFDGEIILWDAQTGEAIRSFFADSKNVTAVGFLNINEEILSCEKNVVKIVDTLSGDVIGFLKGHTSEITCLDSTAKTSVVVTGSDDGTIKIWNGETHEARITFNGHEGGTWQVDISENGKHVLSVEDCGEARLWDIDKGVCVWKSKQEKLFEQIAFSKDGKYFLLSSDVIEIRNVYNGEIVKTAPFLGAWYTSAVFLENGEKIVCGDENGLIHELKGDYRLNDLFLANDNTANIIFPMNTNQLLSVHYSDKHNVLTAAGGIVNGFSHFWDLSTLTITRSLTDFKDPIRYALISPCEKPLLLLQMNNSLTVENIDTEEKTKYFTGFYGGIGGIETAAFSPNGKYGISVYNRNEVVLWNVETGEELRRFTGHDGPIYSLTFHPGGRFILTGSNDGTARIWNIETGEWAAFLADNKGKDWFIFDSDGNWDASEGGKKFGKYISGVEVYELEQYALWKNRPDLILEKLPKPNNERVRQLEIEYNARLAGAGIEKANAGKSLKIPSVEIVKSEKKDQYADLNILFTESEVELKSYSISLNGEPLYKFPGQPLSGQKRIVTERIQLEDGKNIIDIFCMNTAGNISRKKRLEAWNLSIQY